MAFRSWFAALALACAFALACESAMAQEPSAGASPAVAGGSAAGAAASQGGGDVGEGPALLDKLVERDETVDPVAEKRVAFKAGHASLSRELSETGPGAKVDVTIPVPVEGVLFEGVTTPIGLKDLQLGVTVSKFKNGKPESDFEIDVGGLQSQPAVVPKNVSKQTIQFKVRVMPGTDATKPGRVTFSVSRGGIPPAERARRKIVVDVDFPGDAIAFSPPCQTLGCKMRQVWGLVAPSQSLVVPYLTALVWLVIVVFGRDNAFKLLVQAQGWPVIDAATWATVAGVVLFFGGFGLIFTTLPQVAWGGVATGPFWLVLAAVAVVLSAVVMVA